MWLRAIQFAVFGIPLETKILASIDTVQKVLNGYTWWRAVGAKEDRIVVRQKQFHFKSKVLHLPILSFFRPVYYGNLKVEGEVCHVQGKFQLATLVQVICWLVFLALVGWQALAIVRVVNHGLTSERLVDLVGFLLFAIGPITFLVLFFIVLIMATRVAFDDLNKLGAWLEKIKAKAEEERTLPYPDRSENE